MKPITNILLLLALVCYVFLPLFEISLVANLTGLSFTAISFSESPELKYKAFALMPFITMFLAIGFNCLRNRYWGIVVAVLIFLALYFFASVGSFFHGVSLGDNPAVMGEAEMSEGMPVAGMGAGYYSSFALTVLALISTLVSMMPFKFNKRLEERFDKRFESSKKHISKVGHEIHDEFHKIGKHNKQPKSLQEPGEAAEAAEAPSAQQQETEVDHEAESRFMPKQDNDEERYSDYTPK